LHSAHSAPHPDVDDHGSGDDDDRLGRDGGARPIQHQAFTARAGVISGRGPQKAALRHDDIGGIVG